MHPLCHVVVSASAFGASSALVSAVALFFTKRLLQHGDAVLLFDVLDVAGELFHRFAQRVILAAARVVECFAQGYAACVIVLYAFAVVLREQEVRLTSMLEEKALRGFGSRFAIDLRFHD